MTKYIFSLLKIDNLSYLYPFFRSFKQNVLKKVIKRYKTFNFVYTLKKQIKFLFQVVLNLNNLYI